MNTKTMRAMTTLVALMATGCDATDEVGQGESNNTEYNYAFTTEDGNGLEIIDHMGVALTSTSLVNRDDGYQSAAPNSLPYLPAFLINLGKMHTMFADNLMDHGLEPCSWNTGLKDFVTPCTQQRLWEGGPQVQDVVVPDSIEIHLDEPARWPNGRPIQVCTATEAWASDEACAAEGGQMKYLQINDLVLAMGFLDIGAECPGAPGGVCRLETFTDMKLNIDHNDAELPNRFPYLAAPHL